MDTIQIIVVVALGFYAGGFIATFPHIAFMLVQLTKEDWPVWRCIWQAFCVSSFWPGAVGLLAFYFVLTLRDRKLCRSVWIRLRD
jgi:hypothetical protein